MPVTFSGYPAPITTAQLGPGVGTGPSQDEFNKWQQIGSPMGPGGFPAYNAIYNVYGNSGAASLRNAQIGNVGGGSPASGSPTGGVSIPGVSPTGGGFNETTGTSPTQGLSTDSFTQPGGPGSGINPSVIPSGSGLTETTAAGNLAAAPTLSTLTDLINKLNLQGQQASNAGRIPNDPALEAKSSANIGSELAGQLPPDVINLLAQQGAERGVAMGSPGSSNANAGYLRALGLTSLGQQQAGQQNLSAAVARNPGARVFDPSTQLLTPGQAGQLSQEQQQLALEWYKALHPNVGGGGGNRGGGGSGEPPSALPSWFPTLGGTPSAGAPPPSLSGVTQDPNYPGTSIPGLPNLTGILGTPDPGYGLSPDPFGQPSQFDASDPSAWDFTGGYDPFTQY